MLRQPHLDESKPLTAFADWRALQLPLSLALPANPGRAIGLIFRIGIPILCAILTYAALSYRAWSRVVVRPSTLADLQSVPDAAARK